MICSPENLGKVAQSMAEIDYVLKCKQAKEKPIDYLVLVSYDHLCADGYGFNS